MSFPTQNNQGSMATSIKESEITWSDSIDIKFGFTGLGEGLALPILRGMIRKQWPKKRRPTQCVYVIRLKGEVSVGYPAKHSPVIYIGEGDAYSRLYNHAKWLVQLVLSMPQVGIEIRVAEVKRKNHTELYRHIEADLISWFAEDHGSLPWFNLQRERSLEDMYTYEPEAESTLRRSLGVGGGNRFVWAIQPTKNNDFHEQFWKGHGPDE
jgi:hypothetical protein